MESPCPVIMHRSHGVLIPFYLSWEPVLCHPITKANTHFPARGRMLVMAAMESQVHRQPPALHAGGPAPCGDCTLPVGCLLQLHFRPGQDRGCPRQTDSEISPRPSAFRQARLEPPPLLSRSHSHRKTRWTIHVLRFLSQAPPLTVDAPSQAKGPSKRCADSSLA